MEFKQNGEHTKQYRNVMRKIIINCFALLFICFNVYAQNSSFLKSGTIVFEKKINKFAILKKRINSQNESYMQPAYDNYIKNEGQFITLQSTLFFTENASLYQPNATSFEKNDLIDFTVAKQSNTVFTDFVSQNRVAQKNIYGKSYLIKDSLRNINWKITDEVRNIAGYNCKRATAIFMDSIYVVAFYAEEIMCASGPESFSGLPGMILGIALPSQHITWFATKVTAGVPSNNLSQPFTGKPTNYATFKNIMESKLKMTKQLTYIDFLLLLL